MTSFYSTWIIALFVIAIIGVIVGFVIMTIDNSKYPKYIKSGEPLPKGTLILCLSLFVILFLIGLNQKLVSAKENKEVETNNVEISNDSTECFVFGIDEVITYKIPENNFEE